ncbi:MAG: MgtC/SapB family protein [Clostridia bacterium]|nr:MgtC/SapB family protein [Clostridia bacterium]
MFGMTEVEVFIQLEFFGRLILAGICGAVVGYERKRNMKEAGVRTHFIVSLAAALVMLISKYGFQDIVHLPSHQVDVSRVAASVVTGVGFLGAGIIFVRKYTINGLTTAAGIWATSAIGMAIGAGMYIVGIMATLCILLAQVFLHRRWGFMHIPSTEQFRLVISDSPEAVKNIQEILKDKKIEILNIKMEVSENGHITLDLITKLPARFKPVEMMEMFQGNKYVKSIDL